MPLHILSFVGIVAVAVFCPLWVFIICIIPYALFFTAYELLIVALCIDAQFGEPTAGIWYWYTLSVSSVLIVATYVKPYIRFYQ